MKQALLWAKGKCCQIPRRAVFPTCSPTRSAAPCGWYCPTLLCLNFGRACFAKASFPWTRGVTEDGVVKLYLEPDERLSNFAATLSSRFIYREHPPSQEPSQEAVSHRPENPLCRSANLPSPQLPLFFPLHLSVDQHKRRRLSPASLQHLTSRPAASLHISHLSPSSFLRTSCSVDISLLDNMVNSVGHPTPPNPTGSPNAAGPTVSPPHLPIGW